MRTHLPLLAFLFSSLALVAQNAEPSSPSSGNSQAGQTQSATPSAPGTGGPSGHCPVLPRPENNVSPGKVSKGELVHKVSPNYPAALRKAHIQGTVVLCATISKEGTILKLRALSGPEELIPLAIEAVAQWRYKPYTLNKEPVEVDSEIRMDFKLPR